MIWLKQSDRTCHRSKDKLDLCSQHYQATLRERELTLQHFCGSKFRPPSRTHYQQPTMNEASGSHCLVSKPDRATRAIWKPIAGIELIIQITNVIRRENVAPHYKDSYAEEFTKRIGHAAKSPIGSCDPVSHPISGIWRAGKRCLQNC